ncbi:MAG: hypothetical protein WC755_08915 [Candidatus Woesearchaeota archaeon]|jgi:hypothetical protein
MKTDKEKNLKEFTEKALSDAENLNKKIDEFYKTVKGIKKRRMAFFWKVAALSALYFVYLGSFAQMEKLLMLIIVCLILMLGYLHAILKEI